MILNILVLVHIRNILEDGTERFFKENGRSPTWEDFSNNRKYPSFKTYQRHFGSWNKALKMAGLQINYFTEFTDEELLGFLEQFYRETWKVPIIDHFDGNCKYPSFGTYKDRFGSWQKALSLVELDVDSMVRKGNNLKYNVENMKKYEINNIVANEENNGRTSS